MSDFGLLPIIHVSFFGRAYFDVTDRYTAGSFSATISTAAKYSFNPERSILPDCSAIAPLVIKIK